MEKQTYFAHKILLIFFFCNYSLISFSQKLEVFGTNEPPYTVENLISNTFLGQGVEVTNIEYFGNEASVGYFQRGQSSFGIERGIILTTGVVKSNAFSMINEANDEASIDNDVNTGSLGTDPDIQAIAGATIVHDLIKYEITFRPSSDVLRFRYVFASEEYPEYTCRAFNDVFGFFISGPNPSGGNYAGENIAKVPGTNLPVAINNVHNGNPQPIPCTPINPEFYNDNSGSSDFIFDAYLDVFEAEVEVVPCEEYTIKLAIADLGDSEKDSGIFLEAKSFSTQSLNVETITASNDNTLVEECAEAEIQFILPENTPSDLTLNYSVIGTATNGVDYEALPNSITIPAGSNSNSIFVTTIEDDQLEPIETIGIDIQINSCTRDTFWLNIKDKQLIPPMLEDTILICNPGEAVPLDGTIDVAVTESPRFENDNNVVIIMDDFVYYSDITVSGVTPVDLNPSSLQSICIDSLTHSWIEDLDIYLIAPSGVFIELTSDNGGDGGNGLLEDFYIQTCFTPTATQNINFGMDPGAPASEVPFTGEYAPDGYMEDLWEGNQPANGTWRLMIIDDTPIGIGTLHKWSITFNYDYFLNYNWTPATGLSCTDCPNPTATPTTSTTYYYTASDSYGCEVLDTVHIEVASSIPMPTVNCDNTNSGEILFTWDNVGSQFEVNINGAGWVSPNQPPLNHLVTGLMMGESVDFQIRVTTDCGDGPIAMESCSALDCIPSTPSLDNVSAVNCPGDSNGSLTVSASGGTAPFTFTLNGTSNDTGIFSGLEAGDYTVDIMDDLGCPTSIDVTVPAPDTLMSDPLIVLPIGCNGALGSVSVELTGGTAPFTFSWSNMSTDSIATGLINGDYDVTITDDNGCSTTDMVTLDEPISIFNLAVPTDALCNGEASGSIVLNTGGGAGSYSYVWDNGMTADSIGGLTAGDYTVTITDAVNCTYEESFTLNEPSDITSTSSASDATCFNTLDGSVSVTPMGGTIGSGSDYTYLWSNDSTTSSIPSIVAGNYYVTITDDNGCEQIDSALVNSPPAISTIPDTINVSCFGLTNGEASVTSSGGTGNLTYLWDNGVSATSITDLPAGSYTVLITDENMCTDSVTIEVLQPAEIEVVVDSMGVDCNGAANGTIAITPSGGNGGFSFEWSDGSTNEDLSGVSAGIYGLTITDSNNCETQESITLQEGESIQSSYAVTDVNCFSESTGSITASISGPSGPFSYQWSNGADSLTLSNVEAGTYFLTITDVDNCDKIDSVVVAQPIMEIDGAAEVTDVECFGQETGTIIVEGLGGTAPYTYSINGSNFGPNNTFVGLGANEYYVFIQDENECVASLPITLSINEPPEIEVELGDNFTIDLGESANLNASIFNTVGSTSIEWITPDTSIISCMDCPNPLVNTIETQTFEIVVTDENGCIGQDRITIFVNTEHEVLVPTAFTPNADGFNDLLLVHGTSSMVNQILSFQLYDRWGELVFEDKGFTINDPTRGWDGQYKGKDMVPGVYVWYVEVQYIDGSTKGFKGETNLLR